MKSKFRILPLTATLAAGFLTATAQAGGPLFLGENGDPLAWDVTDPVRVYTDLGDLCDDDASYPYNGCISN